VNHGKKEVKQPTGLARGGGTARAGGGLNKQRRTKKKISRNSTQGGGPFVNRRVESTGPRVKL